MKTNPRTFHHRAAALLLAVSMACPNPAHAATALPEKITPALESLLELVQDFHVDEVRRKAGSKTILFIQDVHDSPEAQIHTAELITHAVEKANVRTVFEEGYEGPVPSDAYFEKVQDRAARKRVSDFLLDHLRIGAAEYAHINRSREFKLIGADSFEAQIEGWKAYRESYLKEKSSDAELREMEMQLLAIAKKIWPEDFSAWFNLKGDAESAKKQGSAYLQKTFELLRARGGAGYDKEYPLLYQLFTSKNPEPASQDTAAAIQEIARAEKNIPELYLQSAEEKRIFEMLENLRFLFRLLDKKLTAEEAARTEEVLNGFTTEKVSRFIHDNTGAPAVFSRRWENAARQAASFYNTAPKRDGALAERLHSFTQNADEQTAVIVYGGFHRREIQKILEREGVSFAVLSPKISAPSEKHSRYYQALMSGPVLSPEAPGVPADAMRPPSVYFMAGAQEIIPQISKDLETLGAASADSPDYFLNLQETAQKSELRTTRVNRGRTTIRFASGFENYPVVFDSFDPEQSHFNMAVNPGPSGHFSYSHVTREGEWDGTPVSYPFNSPEINRPWSELEQKIQAPGADKIVFSYHNLYWIDWFIVYDGAAGQLYHRRGEPFEARTYPVFVSWTSGRFTSEDVRFKYSKRDKRYQIFRAADPRRDLSSKIRYAVFGQRLVNKGKAVALQELAAMFADQFQVFQYPQEIRRNPDGSFFYGESIGLSETAEGPAQPITADDRPRMKAALADHGYIEIDLAPYLKRFWLWQIKSRFLNGELLNGRRYHEVQPKRADELKTGEYFIDEKNILHIRLYGFPYPHNLIGITRSGRAVSILLAGNKNEGAGYEMDKIGEKIVSLGEETRDPIESVFLMANSRDAFRRENRKISDASGPELYTRGTAAIVFTVRSSTIGTVRNWHEHSVLLHKAETLWAAGDLESMDVFGTVVKKGTIRTDEVYPFLYDSIPRPPNYNFAFYPTNHNHQRLVIRSTARSELRARVAPSDRVLARLIVENRIENSVTVESVNALIPKSFEPNTPKTYSYLKRMVHNRNLKVRRKGRGRVLTIYALTPQGVLLAAQKDEDRSELRRFDSPKAIASDAPVVFTISSGTLEAMAPSSYKELLVMLRSNRRRLSLIVDDSAQAGPRTSELKKYFRNVMEPSALERYRKGVRIIHFGEGGKEGQLVGAALIRKITDRFKIYPGAFGTAFEYALHDGGLTGLQMKDGYLYDPENLYAAAILKRLKNYEVFSSAA